MKNLAVNAQAFAKQYVALVEALQREGVPELIAREEARCTALLILFEPQEGGACPLCGHAE